MAGLQIETQVVEGVPEVRLLGELDSFSAPQVRQVLRSLIAEKHPVMRMRLSGVAYIDSAGIGVLVGALKQTNDHAGMFVLVEPSPQVSYVLHVTGLERLFTVLSDQPLPSVAPA